MDVVRSRLTPLQEELLALFKQGLYIRQGKLDAYLPGKIPTQYKRTVFHKLVIKRRVRVTPVKELNGELCWTL